MREIKDIKYNARANDHLLRTKHHIFYTFKFILYNNCTLTPVSKMSKCILTNWQYNLSKKKYVITPNITFLGIRTKHFCSENATLQVTWCFLPIEWSSSWFRSCFSRWWRSGCRFCGSSCWLWGGGLSPSVQIDTRLTTRRCHNSGKDWFVITLQNMECTFIDFLGIMAWKHIFFMFQLIPFNYCTLTMFRKCYYNLRVK